jgi:hypothetical protein
MAIVISEVYEAFRVVGVSEDSARKAAEALSSENLATKSDISDIQKELLVMKWMLAVVVAATVLPLLKGSIL